MGGSGVVDSQMTRTGVRTRRDYSVSPVKLQMIATDSRSERKRRGHMALLLRRPRQPRRLAKLIVNGRFLKLLNKYPSCFVAFKFRGFLGFCKAYAVACCSQCSQVYNDSCTIYMYTYIYVYTYIYIYDCYLRFCQSRIAVGTSTLNKYIYIYTHIH